MSSTNAPIGLKPAFHPSGTVRQSQIAKIDQASAFYQFQPVAIDADGQLIPAVPEDIDPQLVDNFPVGVFLGIEWTGTDGRRRVGNQWVADTPIKTDSDLVAYYSSDPEMVYEIQANASTTDVILGDQFLFTVPTPGNQEEITGLFQGVLDIGTAITNSGPLIVTGLNPGPNNAWEDDFPVVQVIINLHRFRAGRDPAFAPV